ncbi:MAG: GntR family transcriptional regulator [Pseudomonadota bacterium]
MGVGAQARTGRGKAHRVYLTLRSAIMDGTYAAGSPLPGEPRLADQFAVSRVTLRRALDRLAEEGLVTRAAGKATTVRPAPPDAPAIAPLCVPGLSELEQRTEARLLAFSYVPAGPEIAQALAIAPGAMVQRAVRVRVLAGTPLSHLTTHVPAEIARTYSEAELATTPLFRLLERSGVAISGASQSVTAALAPPDIAEALAIEPGSATLNLTRVVDDETGRPVEHLAAVYRPDRYRLAMRFHRIEDGGTLQWRPVIGSAA